MGWLGNQNLTDSGFISADVFDAPIGGTPSYLGSFDANGNYTGIGYGQGVGLPIQPNGASSSGSSSVLQDITPTSSVSAASPSTGSQPQAAAATANASSPSGGVGGTIADYFARAVIIILGFIFVAVGLGMFRGNMVLQAQARQ